MSAARTRSPTGLESNKIFGGYALNANQMHGNPSVLSVEHPRLLKTYEDHVDAIDIEMVGMNDEGQTTAAPWVSVRERRKFRRKRCLLPAQLITNAGDYECRVLDLSEGGAKLETSAVVHPEQAVTLVVKPIGTFAGLVAWCGDGIFGMRFLAQHGRASSRAASLQASLLVAEGSEPQAGPSAGMRQATGEAAAAPDAVPSAAEDEAQAFKAGGSMSGGSFGLHDGDVICLLRKKSNGHGPSSKSSPPTNGRLEMPAGRGPATFIEIGAREFLELAQQTSACTVSFMRIAEREKAKRLRQG